MTNTTQPTPAPRSGLYETMIAHAHPESLYHVLTDAQGRVTLVYPGTRVPSLEERIQSYCSIPILRPIARDASGCWVYETTHPTRWAALCSALGETRAAELIAAGQAGAPIGPVAKPKRARESRTARTASTSTKSRREAV